MEISPEKLQNYNLTFDEVSQKLKSSNVDLPAGTIMRGLFRYSLRTLGEFDNIEQISNTPVKYFRDGSVLKLKDIGRVKESFRQREGLTRLNGSETVGLLVYKQPDANTVTISNRVNQVIKTLRAEYPEYNLTLVSDHSDFIENAISNVKQEVLYGGILATIVLFFFLGNLRNIFAIAITIPASLVTTILLMYIFDINFNIISLGGIAVGVGMLLDNSIVVIENIVRYKEQGYSLIEAAKKGAGEVSMPVVAATLTTIVVFLPLIFIRGISGELFRDQSLAIAFSLTASILAALTLIPMIVSREKFIDINREKFSKDFITVEPPPDKGIFKRLKYWLKFPFSITFKTIKYVTVKTYLWISDRFGKLFGRFFNTVNNWMDKLIAYYERLLLWSLNNRMKVLFITLILIVLTAFAVVDIEKEFIPDAAKDEFVVELLYPKGTSLMGNAEMTAGVEDAALRIPSVVNVVSNIGRVNEFDFLNKEQYSVSKSNLIIKLDSYESYFDVRNKLRKVLKRLSGVDYSFKQVKTAYTQVISASKYDISVKIKNKDIREAVNKAELIKEQLEKKNLNGIEEVVLGMEKGLPGYSIKVNRDKCLAYGLDIRNVANTIVSLVKGDEATYFSDFDKKVAVRVSTRQSNKNELSKILNETVNTGGRTVAIRELVDYKRTETYSEIRREDQTRTVHVYADVADGSMDNVMKELNQIISGIPKSTEEIISVGGVNEDISKSFSKLYIALLISVLLMYMILASEFESFLYPFIIIFSVPLGLIGGILLLYMFGESISIISLMGLIILVGIADNDAVVKVEFILRKRKEGMSVRDAVVQAGRDRFRPIVMNSLTVIFGLIPMILSVGAATQLRISLALAVAGGLISATLLTLIIIPVLYTFFEKYSKKY